MPPNSTKENTSNQWLEWKKLQYSRLDARTPALSRTKTNNTPTAVARTTFSSSSERHIIVGVNTFPVGSIAAQHNYSSSIPSRWCTLYSRRSRDGCSVLLKHALGRLPSTTTVHRPPLPPPTLHVLPPIVHHRYSFLSRAINLGPWCRITGTTVLNKQVVVTERGLAKIDAHQERVRQVRFKVSEECTFKSHGRADFQQRFSGAATKAIEQGGMRRPATG